MYIPVYIYHPCLTYIHTDIISPRKNCPSNIEGRYNRAYTIIIIICTPVYIHVYTGIHTVHEYIYTSIYIYAIKSFFFFITSVFTMDLLDLGFAPTWGLCSTEDGWGVIVGSSDIADFSEVTDYKKRNTTHTHMITCKALNLCMTFYNYQVCTLGLNIYIYIRYTCIYIYIYCIYRYIYIYFCFVVRVGRRLGLVWCLWRLWTIEIIRRPVFFPLKFSR